MAEILIALFLMNGIQLRLTTLFLILSLMVSAQRRESASSTGNPLSENEKKRLLELVNEARSKGCRCGSRKMPPVGAVSWNEQLETAAEKHSLDMARHKFMSHEGSDGSKFSARLTQAGFKWTSCAENIAEGYESVETVVDAWLNSPLHCKNLMDPRSRFMGVARTGTYWTQDFGGK